MRRLIKHSSVPTLSDFYNSLDYDFVNMGLQTVNVSDIVGMTNGRNDDYNDDFTPKKKDDSRWDYQKQLIEDGHLMEPIPLIEMPNGKYVGNGDGSHRISVAHVLGLQTVKAYVSKMVSKDQNVNSDWEEYASDKINKLEELCQQYRDLNQTFPEVQDRAYDMHDSTELNKLRKQLNDLNSQISELDEELRTEEQEFKRKRVGSIFSRLKRMAYHDQFNRDSAFLFVDGKGYTGEDHGDCINKFLNQENIQLNGKDEYNEINSRKSAFGHIVGNNIYLMTDIINNMSLSECINLIKQAYPNFNIYDDDNPKFDDNDNIYYDKLAKMIVSYHTNDNTKEWIDDRVKTLIKHNPDMDKGMSYGIAWKQYKKEHPSWEPKND